MERPELVGQARQKFPILASLLASGVIRIEGAEYVGTASDGVTVILGNVCGERFVESYLRARPLPSDW